MLTPDYFQLILTPSKRQCANNRVRNIMKKLMWYAAGLNKYLSENGFVHYLTGEKIIDDFTVGRAFFFDHEKREFGLVDMIGGDCIDSANELTKHFEDSGSLEI